jgi:hypothetical protein
MSSSVEDKNVPFEDYLNHQKDKMKEMWEVFSYILYVYCATILLHDKEHMYPILDKFMVSKIQFSIFSNF